MRNPRKNANRRGKNNNLLGAHREVALKPAQQVAWNVKSRKDITKGFVWDRIKSLSQAKRLQRNWTITRRRRRGTASLGNGKYIGVFPDVGLGGRYQLKGKN